jgi:hypothetical protein
MLALTSFTQRLIQENTWELSECLTQRYIYSQPQIMNMKMVDFLCPRLYDNFKPRILLASSVRFIFGWCWKHVSGRGVVFQLSLINENNQ